MTEIAAQHNAGEGAAKALPLSHARIMETPLCHVV